MEKRALGTLKRDTLHVKFAKKWGGHVLPVSRFLRPWLEE